MNPADFQATAELQAIAATNHWFAIYPEVAVALLSLLVLVVDLLAPRGVDRTNRCGVLAIGGLLGLFAVVAWDVATGAALADYRVQATFGGLLTHSPIGDAFRLLFLLASALVCVLGLLVLPRQAGPKVEFFHVVLVATAALMLLVQSHHFVSLFVALETVTVCFYVLVSYFRRSVASLEAGIKYLVLGALSSGLLLFGIVLLYGVAGTPGLAGATAQAMNFAELAAFLRVNPENFIALAGVVLVLSGVAFKIGAFPFQLWIPDVYQGAPTPATALLAVSSKAAGVGLLLVLVHGPFRPLSGFLLPLLTVAAGATILFGNFAALTQRNLKRLMGLSGVAHAGYLLLGVAASLVVEWAAWAVVFYLAAYLLASMAVFGVMAHVGGADDAIQDLDDYESLARRSPFLAGVLGVGLGSLAGIPPLAGFMGKLLLFIAAFQAGLYGLLAVAIIGVIVSIYYYFGWLRAAYFDGWRLPPVPGEAEEPAPVLRRVSVPVFLILGTLAAGSVVLGFLQGPLGTLIALARVPGSVFGHTP